MTGLKKQNSFVMVATEYMCFLFVRLFSSKGGNMARSEIREKEGKILISCPVSIRFYSERAEFPFFEALHACISLLETL